MGFFYLFLIYVLVQKCPDNDISDQDPTYGHFEHILILFFLTQEDRIMSIFILWPIGTQYGS